MERIAPTIYMQKIHLTLAQIGQCDYPETNLEFMIEVIDQVRTNFLVFPETQLTGKNQTAELAKYHQVLAERAKRRQMWMVYGAYEREGAKVFNTARMVSDWGETKYVYKKRHLWNEPGVTAGDSNEVVETPFGGVGMVICWDLAYPTSVSELLYKGVYGTNLIICPSYWFGEKYGTTQVIENLPLVRAFENQVYIAYCDADSLLDETAARSKICSPLNVVAGATPRHREIVSAYVDLGQLREMRKTFDCWRWQHE